MFKFTLTSIALLGLASLASAQTNINRINGNGNTVINRSVGGSTASNFNKINGNGNTVINRTQPSSSTTLVGGDPSTWSPTYRPVAPVVVYKQPVQYVEPQPEYYQEPSAPVCENENCPTSYYVPMPVQPVYVARPQPIYTQPTYTQPIVRPTPSIKTTPSVNLNFNLNQINGNGNRVVNNTTGGGSGANININRINGNGNTVVNRTRP